MESICRPKVLPRETIEENEYSANEVLHASNYGSGPLFEKLTSVWGDRKDLRDLFGDIWDASLIAEIARRVFGADRTPIYHSDNFEGRIRIADNEILLSIIVLFSEAYDVKVFIPRAYVLVDLSAFVEYLRETVKTTAGESRRSLLEEFEYKRNEIRDEIFGFNFYLNHC